MSFVMEAGTGVAACGRSFLIREPAQGAPDVLQVRTVGLEHEDLIGLDGSRRLQPLPRRRAAVA